MPNPSNDDVAKALERLAAGQSDEPVAPSDDVSHAAAAPIAASPAPVPTARPVAPIRPPGTGATPQPRPVVSRSAAPVPAANRPLQPPGSAAPQAPRPPGASESTVQPASAASARPAAPAARQSEPKSGPARPSAPVIPVAEPVSETEAIDDDDRVIVPAPSADVFMHHRPAAARAKAKHGSSLRRTFIPILLTSGFILFALAVLHFAWPGDNPLASTPAWLVAILFVFAIALWALAAMNMLTVKHELDARKHA